MQHVCHTDALQQAWVHPLDLRPRASHRLPILQCHHFLARQLLHHAPHILSRHRRRHGRHRSLVAAPATPTTARQGKGEWQAAQSRPCSGCLAGLDQQFADGAHAAAALIHVVQWQGHLLQRLVALQLHQAQLDLTRQPRGDEVPTRGQGLQKVEGLLQHATAHRHLNIWRGKQVASSVVFGNGHAEQYILFQEGVAIQLTRVQQLLAQIQHQLIMVHFCEDGQGTRDEPEGQHHLLLHLLALAANDV
mmetsp:Transcript_1167/g.2764  ORF Transcript_1167/g.2764 Transcript_1167/m.2764 type:complete len:248 (-) Transcript_1167:429-1172(-)